MAIDPSELKTRLLSQVDRAQLQAIACDLVDIPSPTGFE